MAKITGIGGVFFTSKGKGADLAAWYQKNLGLELESWGGAILRWPDDKAENGDLVSRGIRHVSLVVRRSTVRLAVHR